MSTFMYTIGTSSSNTTWEVPRGGVYTFEFRIEFGLPPAPPKPKPKPPINMTCAHRFLGVDCKATRAVITSAYRRLAKANHPDTGPLTEREARTRKMAEYNRAYEGALGQLGTAE